MRSEKEIDDMIAKLSTEESPSMSAAIMALMWVRGDDIGGMLQSAIDKSVESLREHWANRTICMGEDEVAPFDDGEWEYLKALKLVSVQPPHAPATPPPEG